MAIFLLATLTAGLSMMTSMVQSANAAPPPTAGSGGGCHVSTGSNGCGGGGYGIFSNSGGFACIVKQDDTCHGKSYPHPP